jgi:hypothetical protein
LTTVARGGAQRTYSIWGLVALFVGLTAFGVIVFIGGSPTSPTEQVAGPQTPNTVLEGSGSHESALSGGNGADGLGSDVDGSGGAASSSTTSSTSTTAAAGSTSGQSADPSAPVTVPGGGPAPEGVREVLTAEDATSYTFDISSEFPAAGATTAVAPTRVTPAADGTSLTASVGCAASAQEVLGQLSVNEGAAAVTVVAVVLVPAGGAPCDPAAAPREVTVPLTQPLGTRAVVVVPAGTPIAQIAPA